MMNLAAKKKKEANKHRHNCDCTDAAVAEALFKTNASKNYNMNRSISHEPSRPSLSREVTVESATSCDIPLPIQPSANHFSPDRCSSSTAATIIPNGTHPNNNDPLFKLNIGGKSFKIRIDAVMTCRQPSLLTALIKANHEQRLLVVDGFIDETGEYYMERNVRVADHILDYYVTGLLHKPNDVCSERFKEELDFWRLRHDQIAPCCSILGEYPKLKEQEETDKEFDNVIFSDIRWSIWRITEDPSASLFSKIFSFISIAFIFLSVVGLILGSMPEFQEDNSQADSYHMIYLRRPKGESSNSKFDNEGTNANLTNFVYKATDNPNKILVILEYICISWFTFEYIIRFLVSPRKYKFVVSAMNLIDFATILPFYIEMSLSAFGIKADSNLRSVTGAMLVIRVLRVLRMARVFKLARYSQGLQIFGNTLRASMTELSMLSMFLVTGTVFFSTIMYFLEKDEPNTDFYSIPAACWWCITTVTTVGYGDVFPITTAGKSVATAASICGIIILAFPISMIVEKFASAQQQALVEEQIKQTQMSAVANDYLLKRFPTRRKACKDPMIQQHKIQQDDDV